MGIKHAELFRSLNKGQLSAYHEIVDAVTNNLGRMFFVDGFGGSGKTYLWNALSYYFIAQGKIVVNVASSGIASLLLPGGRTAHSQFGIPLVLTEESICRLDRKGKKEQLLGMASLIIWDEAPMISRLAFESFERCLRDVMNKVVEGSSKLPFGGKTIVLGGDFRQILHVVPRGGRADIVHATINSSPLWRRCTVLKLTQNMRLQFSDDIEENKSVREFAKWILDIGDGKLGDSDDGESVIEIPEDLRVKSSGNHIVDIIDAIYPDLMQNMGDYNFFQDRAILAPTLQVVEKVNDYVMCLLPSEDKQYLSCDSICQCDEDVGIDRRWITTEFLNDIKCSGMPNHKLRLKLGVPVMLLRNIDVSSGLCNGTRLMIVELGKNVIGADIVNGPHHGDRVYITRSNLIPSDSNVNISFQRRQFPLCLCFAMTINKSQGQTLSNVGLYLPRPVFTHGQLYVAVSRVKTRKGLKILALDDSGDSSTFTTNVVYEEVFRKI
jgi:ATP-dependent DNA helicase PIF1